AVPGPQSDRPVVARHSDRRRLVSLHHPTGAGVMQLWRPVGAKEPALIEASGWKAFPPRLPEQPIFYPVLNFDYAEQIAREWNTRNGEEGYVVTFDVDDAVARRYPVQ